MEFILSVTKVLCKGLGCTVSLFFITIIAAVQQALLDIKRKFGKNSVIKAMDMFDGATGQQRNNQIGGHAA